MEGNFEHTVSWGKRGQKGTALKSKLLDGNFRLGCYPQGILGEKRNILSKLVIIDFNPFCFWVRWRGRWPGGGGPGRSRIHVQSAWSLHSKTFKTIKKVPLSSENNYDEIPLKIYYFHKIYIFFSEIWKKSFPIHESDDCTDKCRPNSSQRSRSTFETITSMNNTI